jgi:hypothetical protein
MTLMPDLDAFETAAEWELPGAWEIVGVDDDFDDATHDMREFNPEILH